MRVKHTLKAGEPMTTKPIGGTKEIRKGTGDVLKDLAYAQRYMEEFAQGDFAGRLGLEMSFVERALRLATGEIKQLHKRLEATPGGGAPGYSREEFERDLKGETGDRLAERTTHRGRETPREVAPIPLNAAQEQAAKNWAADDRLWTTQETVEVNLRTFARVILKEATPTAPPGEDIREAFRQGFHWAVTGTRTASAAIAEGIAWGAFQRGERIGPLTHTAPPAGWCVSPDLHLHSNVGHIAACFIDPNHGSATPAASEEQLEAKISSITGALREALDSLMQRRGVAILEAVRAKDRGLGYQVGMLLDAIARITNINSPSLPAVPFGAAPPVYVRCICNHPGDTLSCPSDHDQIERG